MSKLTKPQLMAKLNAVEPETKEQRNEIVCSLIGHSRIRTLFFGYNYCGRCENQLGDSLGGVWQVTDHYIEGHDDKECLDNLGKMTWVDKLYVPKKIYTTIKQDNKRKV